MPPKPSDPVHRPEPAVGQVWSRSSGVRYMILQQGASMYQKLYDDGDLYVDYQRVSHCVEPSDVYVGQFAGFKVQDEEGGK